MDAKKKSELGFTLLEIMIALAILSISLLSLYDSIGNSLRASGMAKEMEEAVLLAKQRMSEIQLQLEQEMALGSFPDEKEEHGDFEKPFEKYKWSYKLKKVEIPVIRPLLGQGDPQDSPSSIAPTTPGFQESAANVAELVSKKISNSLREIKLIVSWGDSEDSEEKIILTTHVANLK